MKTITKFAAAALFAVAAAAPAFAVEGLQTSNERNSYLYTAAATPIAEHMQQVQQAETARGADAYAFVPATQPSFDPAVHAHEY